MNHTVEVRSTGRGPRATKLVRPEVYSAWFGVTRWVHAAVEAVRASWPNDGVAIIIRRVG